MKRVAQTLLPFLALLFTALVPVTSFAGKFANQFTEFELPPQWTCNLEGAEWVCQSSIEGKKRDAIIVLAAKLKGDQDSLDQYLMYLKLAKAFTSVGGKPLKSEPKYAKIVPINGQSWVDSLHLESELPGYYTRYLATVKTDIGVLITYSVKKSKYNDYLNDFENMIKTLKVFRKAGGINVAPASGNLFGNISIPQAPASNDVFPVAPDTPAPAKPKSDSNLPFYALAGGGVLFYFWRRRRNQD